VRSAVYERFALGESTPQAGVEQGSVRYIRIIRYFYEVSDAEEGAISGEAELGHRRRSGEGQRWPHTSKLRT